MTDFTFITWIRYRPGEPWVELCRSCGPDEDQAYLGAIELGRECLDALERKGMFRWDQASLVILPYGEKRWNAPYAFDWESRKR